MRRGLWVPGHFLGTNKFLDLQRAAGYYAGYARGSRERQRPPRMSFATETAAIRDAVANTARADALAPPTGPVGIYFRLQPAERAHDPDSWYLAAKAALDGLVTAGVILSDRTHVTWTGGRCVREPEELRAALVVHGYCFTGRPGLLIELVPTGGPDGVH